MTCTNILNEQYPNGWIGCGGPIAQTLRSLYLNSLDLFVATCRHLPIQWFSILLTTLLTALFSFSSIRDCSSNRTPLDVVQEYGIAFSEIQIMRLNLFNLSSFVKSCGCHIKIFFW